MYPDETFIEHLYQFYKDRGIETVGDWSGGRGKKIRGLAERGLTVVYNDINTELKALFEADCARRDVRRIKATHEYDWVQLHPSRIGTVDAGQCLGYSIGYADGGSNINPARARAKIQTVLHNFRALSPRLLIDLYKENEPERHTINIPEIGTMNVNGEEVALRWDIRHDGQIRRITRHLTIDGVACRPVERESYLLGHAELEEMLKAAGFPDVKKVEIQAEKHYDIYFAQDQRRPVGLDLEDFKFAS